MQTTVQNWNSVDVSASKWPLRLMPSLTDLAFLLPVLYLFLKLSGTKILFADADTGWHIRTGEWILDHHAVPQQDLFSFTKPHAAWFAWEWGWDVLFALIHRFWGLGGVGFVSVIVLGLCSVLLYKLTVRACGNELLGFAVTVVAICGSAIHWLARPHLFSWIFFLLFLHLLRDAEDGQLKSLRWLPPLMIVWTNVHGAFFVGIVLVLTSAAGEGIQTLWAEGRRDRPLPASLIAAFQAAKPYLVCAAFCAAATLVNPYTWRLHLHVLEFLRNAELMNRIQEYQTVSFHDPAAIFFECMLIAGIAAAFWSLRSGRIVSALGVLCWAHLALYSGRNIPFFLMIAAPPVAGLLESLLRRISGPSAAPAGVGAVASTLREICDELKPLERVPRLHLVSAVTLVLLAGLFAAGREGFESEFNSDVFPHQAIPVVESSTASRIFTYDQWGDYLIYKLYPAKRVFIDGRADLYGSAMATDYLNLVNAHFDWKQQLSRFSVDMVIVKPDAPLSTVLKTAPSWKLLFDDGKVLVFKQNLGDARSGR